MFAINVYLHVAKCEHFKLTKGDSNKMVLCLKDYRLDKVCTVSLRQLVVKNWWLQGRCLLK